MLTIDMHFPIEWRWQFDPPINPSTNKKTINGWDPSTIF